MYEEGATPVFSREGSSRLCASDSMTEASTNSCSGVRMYFTKSEPATFFNSASLLFASFESLFASSMFMLWIFIIVFEQSDITSRDSLINFSLRRFTASRLLDADWSEDSTRAKLICEVH